MCYRNVVDEIRTVSNSRNQTTTNNCQRRTDAAFSLRLFFSVSNKLCCNKLSSYNNRIVKR